MQFTYDQRLEFGLYDHKTKDDTINAVRRIAYMSGGTATGEAIRYCTRNLFKYYWTFLPSCFPTLGCLACTCCKLSVPTVATVTPDGRNLEKVQTLS